MRSLLKTAVAGSVLAVLAGCSSTEKPRDEDFAMSDTYTRNYEVPPDAVCAAGRRALLSQGYNIDRAEASRVAGHKNFQNEEGQHTQIKFSMECSTDGGKGGAMAFASALEDRYSIKTVSNSASVGLSVLGSVSMPTGSSPDSLVKTASQTIARPAFYSGFFELLERYLPSPEEARAAAATSQQQIAPSNVTAPARSAAPTPTHPETPPPPSSQGGVVAPASAGADDPGPAVEAGGQAGADSNANANPPAASDAAMAPSESDTPQDRAAPSDVDNGAASGVDTVTPESGAVAPDASVTPPESGAATPESNAAPAVPASPSSGSL